MPSLLQPPPTQDNDSHNNRRPRQAQLPLLQQIQACLEIGSLKNTSWKECEKCKIKHARRKG